MRQTCWFTKRCFMGKIDLEPEILNDPQDKVRDMFERFPFLGQVIDEDYVDSADITFVNKTLREPDKERIDMCFFTKQHELVGRIGHRWRYKNPKRRCWQLWRPLWLESPSGTSVVAQLVRVYSVEYDTLENTLVSIPNLDAAHYVVTVTESDMGTTCLIIHEPLPSFSFRDWLPERTPQPAV